MKTRILVTASLAALVWGCSVYAQSYPSPPADPGPGSYNGQNPNGQPPSDNQGYGNQGQGYDNNQGYDNQGYDPQDPYYPDPGSNGSSQDPGAYNDPGYNNQGYDTQGYDNNQGPADTSVFYSQLSPYGRWIQRGSYGWVWEPTRVPVGWRPYTAGRWVNTDYGWTWVSDEPWGWATYHYGRWMPDREYGWLWVPGTEWGPAWVSFQQGNGYIGWAPLPPSVGFRAGIGLQIGGLSLSAEIDPYAYSFVPERSFLDERVETVILPPARNVTIVRNTTNFTNIAVVNNRVVNQGIPLQRVEQATGQRVRRYQLNAAASPAQGRVARIQGDQVSIFRPAATLAPARPNVTPTAVLQRRQQQLQQRQAGPRVSQPGQPGQPPREVQPGQQPQAVGRVQPGNVQPAPSDADLARKHQREQQQLQARQEAERNRLGQLHQREQQDAQAQQRAQEVAAQHQAEQRAQQEQQQREQQVLQARQQRERQAAQARPQRQNQPNPPNQQNRNERQQERRKPEPPPPPPPV